MFPSNLLAREAFRGLRYARSSEHSLTKSEALQRLTVPVARMEHLPDSRLPEGRCSLDGIGGGGETNLRRGTSPRRERRKGSHGGP